MGSAGGSSNNGKKKDDDPFGMFTSAIDTVTQGLGLGTAGNGYQDGYLKHAATETVGELNGSNKARKQQMNDADAVEAERVARLKELKDQQQVNQQNDLAASNAAGARNKSTYGTDNFMTADQSLKKDFLGL